MGTLRPEFEKKYFNIWHQQPQISQNAKCHDKKEKKYATKIGLFG